MKQSYNTNAGWWAFACAILGIMGLMLLILLLQSVPAEGQSEVLELERKYRQTLALANARAEIVAQIAPDEARDVVRSAYRAGVVVGLMVGTCEMLKVPDTVCRDAYEKAGQ